MYLVVHGVFSSCVSLQTEIVKRLNALINQLLPFLAQEHQQQVIQAVERAKQITVPELNAIIGVSGSAPFCGMPVLCGVDTT